MPALTGTEKSRLSRERARLGLKQLIVWVPRDKLQDCKDAIDKIVKGDVEGAPTGRWVSSKDLHPMTNVWRRKWRVVHLDGSIKSGTYYGEGSAPQSSGALEWWFEN